MKTIYRLITLMLILVFAVISTQAQSRKSGLNSAAFLKVGVGARNVAMGSATTALSNDVNQVFWNPAGTALKDQQLQVAFNYNKWIGDLNHNCAAISYNLRDIGTLSLGVITFGASDIKADRDVFPDDPILKDIRYDMGSGNTYNYMDMAVSLTYSRYLLDNLSLGATVKFINESIDDQSTSAMAFDMGSIYDIGIMGWKIAARISNLGGDIKFYDYTNPIPLTFSIGTSLMPFNEEQYKLLVSIEGLKPQDGPQIFYAGGELTIMDMLFLRGGYKINYSGTKDDGTAWREAAFTTLEGASFGAGVKVPIDGYDVTVDYAFTQMNLFSNAHRISVHFGLK